MNKKCQLRIAHDNFSQLYEHLFPGDHDEHGAVLLAGVSDDKDVLRLLVREFHPAVEGKDYVEGKFGYRALHPTFIHRLITRARDQRLAYLAVHNHGSDRSVAFSRIDLDSHERGYPALLQIARGMPVGALVVGHNSIQADVWSPDGTRLQLREAVVIGNTIKELTPSPAVDNSTVAAMFERQTRMFGALGQRRLSKCHAAIIGLGGIGSLIAEYLARLGVGHLQLIDSDVVEPSNLSRIVGAALSDAADGKAKVEVARRVILQANPSAIIDAVFDDVAKESVARRLRANDYVFLAADSMRARLVFNALVHQYLIPGVQLGSKIRPDASGALVDVMSVNRAVRPGYGCLWCNQLIDPTALATEAKTDFERKAQAYGVAESNPSVIALNAISAAHAVNDFMLDYLNLRSEPDMLRYEQFGFLKRTRTLVEPRRDNDCSECSHAGKRYARGDSAVLPCVEG